MVRLGDAPKMCSIRSNSHRCEVGAMAIASRGLTVAAKNDLELVQRLAGRNHGQECDLADWATAYCSDHADCIAALSLNNFADLRSVLGGRA